MRSIDSDGLFWKAETPEVQIAGHLTYDDEAGGRLQLIGGFTRPPQILDEGPPSRILGFADGQLVTLEACRRGRIGFDGVGLQHEEWVPWLIFAGVHWDTEESILISGLSVSFDELPIWASLAPMASDLERSDSGEVEGFSLSIGNQPLEGAPFEGGWVEISHSWGFSGNHLTEAQLSQSSKITITYDGLTSLDVFLEDLIGFRDIVSLGVDAPAIVESIVLTSSELIDTVGSTPRETPIELFVQQRNPLKDEVQNRFRTPFRLDQMGGASALANWIVASRKYRSAIASLTSGMYMKTLYLENRYQNTLDSAETLHRITFPNYRNDPEQYELTRAEIADSVPKQHRGFVLEATQYGNEPRLKHRLTDLANLCGVPLTDLIDDTKLWGEVMARLRNGLVHHDPDSPALWEIEDLFWAERSVRRVVTVALLRKIEVEDSAVDSICSLESIKNEFVRTNEIVSRVHQGIVAARKSSRRPSA